MAVSKIEMKDKVSVITESVTVLSNGTDNFKKIEIPYHNGYRPVGISAMMASGNNEGYLNIVSWLLSNASSPNPKFEIYWRSNPGADRGVIVHIVYLKI